MQAADIMTRRVVSVRQEQSILDAIDLMLKRRVSGLPVVDDRGHLVGMVTEADFLRRPETGTERRRPRWLSAIFGAPDEAKSYVHSHGIKVGEVMSKNIVTVTESTPLDRVVHLMEIHRIKRVPVLRRGKAVGIVSRANLLRALASLHREERRTSKNDAAIRARILAEIDRQSWSVGADLDLVVRSGMADVWGTIADPAQREALKVLVESTPGIRAVVDHTCCENGITPT